MTVTKDLTDYTPPTDSEQAEIEAIFIELLRSATGDGARKRAAGTKLHWTIDPDHTRGLFNHLSHWVEGDKVDKDSGAHPLVHLAWRALAIAYQENRDREYRASHPECDCHVCKPIKQIIQPRLR